ncbi:DivIVA domain-containing protein [Marinoscillum furvescens]|uniref:Cell division initiation protein n=1 Tax=Marinoscillum furvescens DSM 4134 TaxID=1122208 RepID=A0A3D9KXK7_MARFU|nr:DivIVA domain-containing protein [Marinoscillum furvescens]RED92642.1 cell division initiation protein [Marinoscillum furvescens DSM 4134]
MKITPLEIRQKNFEKKLRGYDKDEVNAFLLSLSNEWERVLDENKELRIKLDQAEKEVQKLREVESSLFKTLKTAEDTGANLIDQANKAAELHLKETQMNADAMMSEAKSKAKDIIEKSEMEARQIIEEMQDAIKDLEQNYRALENHRDNVVSELKNLSKDILDRIQRAAGKQAQPFSLEDHTKKVKALVRESEDRINKEKLEVKPVKMKQLEQPQVPTPSASKSTPAPSAEEQKTPRKTAPKPKKAASEKKAGGSFFDELEE